MLHQMINHEEAYGSLIDSLRILLGLKQIKLSKKSICDLHEMYLKGDV